MREKENSIGDQEVDYEDSEMRIYESGTSDYYLEYTIVGKGYKMNE